MLYSLRSQQRLYKNTNSSRATKTGQLQLISHLNPTEDRPSDAADGSWNRTWVLAKCEKNKKSSIHYRLNTHHSTRSNLHLSDHETQADLLHDTPQREGFSCLATPPSIPIRPAPNGSAPPRTGIVASRSSHDGHSRAHHISEATHAGTHSDLHSSSFTSGCHGA